MLAKSAFSQSADMVNAHLFFAWGVLSSNFENASEMWE